MRLATRASGNGELGTPSSRQRLFHLREESLGSSMEDDAELVEITSRGATKQELNAELLFELGDGLGHGRLREMTFLRRTSNAVQLRNTFEQSQMPDAGGEPASIRIQVSHLL
jgi:hypothetical protein